MYVTDVWCHCVCDTGVNILFDNGQYPHNSLCEAPCLPRGATREVDDGILVVESWLIFVTEYIVIVNTSLRPRIHVDGRSGLAQPDQSAGHATPKSQQPLFCLIVAKNELWCIPFVLVALGPVARINQVMGFFLLPEYINHVCLAWQSGGYPQQHVPLLDSVVGGGMVDEIFTTQMSEKKTPNKLFWWNPESIANYVKKSKVISSKAWPKFLVIWVCWSRGLRRRLSNFLNVLKDRYFKVRVGSPFSDSHPQEICVYHGSVLSWTLFIVKINITQFLKPGVDCSL